ncbi:uroporphyrinogen decarboxylase family protein [Pirellulales bacterium]|nr:uroporphyrinogen decarboxylase family protein [Pirellulales bacterium]
MNSRERVRTTLNHEEPDQVPMMMSASRWVIERIKQHLGGIGAGAETDRALMQRMHLDVWDTRGLDYKSGIGAKYVGPKNFELLENRSGNLFEFFNYHEVITENEYGPAYSMGKPCFGVGEYPGIEELETFPWPQAAWFDFSMIRQQIEPWAEEFAVAATGASVFQHPSLFRGVEQLMFELAGEPQVAQYIVTKVTDFYYGYYERMFEKAGDLIEIFRLADDIGAQDGLFISPKMIEEFVAPHVRRCAELAHHHDIKLMFHTDGNVRQAISSFIEWGIDILDPIQPEIPDMDAGSLKREFGDQLSFCGGVSAQEIMPSGSVSDVKQEVKRVLDSLMPGGGYILSPGHPSLQMDIPPENIAAMYEAGWEHGIY